MICYQTEWRHSSSTLSLEEASDLEALFKDAMVTRLDSSEGNRVILRPNEGLTLETDVGFETLYGGQFYVINSADNTKDPVILSHRHSTTVSLETCPL